MRAREGVPCLSSNPHLKTFENYSVDLRAKRRGELKLKCSRECRALTFLSLVPLHEHINKLPTDQSVITSLYQ